MYSPSIFYPRLFNVLYNPHNALTFLGYLLTTCEKYLIAFLISSLPYNVAYNSANLTI